MMKIKIKYIWKREKINREKDKGNSVIKSSLRKNNRQKKGRSSSLIIDTMKMTGSKIS